MTQNDAYTLIGICVLVLIFYIYYIAIKACIENVSFRIFFIALNVIVAVIVATNLPKQDFGKRIGVSYQADWSTLDEATTNCNRFRSLGYKVGYLIANDGATPLKYICYSCDTAI
ncbi:MAG: hypothetical protein WCK98_02240 [bacterium]